ncbi:MAG: glycosyltransferase [Rhizobiales bacterium]|nr:glycosyltransferase [Hyphomicrobiales bacterium]
MSFDDVIRPYSRDIGLLLAAGLSGRDAARCISTAVEANVTPLEQAVAEDLVGEEGAYRALADFLGLPFAAQPPPFSGEAPWAEAVAAGVAPLRPNPRRWRFAIAPRGRVLRQALGWDARRPRSGLVITTPSRLDRGLLEACAAQAQLIGAHRLPDRSPFDSARDGPRAPMLLWMIGAAAGFTAAMAVDPLLTLTLLSLFVGSLFLVNVVLRLAATASAWPIAHEHPPAPDSRLPVYTVLAPLYREANMAARLASALCALDYPPAKLDVRILLEADDEETRRAFEACDLPSWCSIVVAPPGAPRTKPRALNIGLAGARGELLAIYDAEDRPDPRQLRLAAARFRQEDRTLACLQARLAIENADETWLTRLFALEYASLFGLLLPSLAAQRYPIALGGTSNHFRVEALRDVGGWDAWNVTEDADLGLRFFRRGYRIGALNSVTWEEAPLRLPAWMAQRSRWLKGWMQTSYVHLTAPRRPLRERGGFAALCALAMSLGSVLTALFGPFLFGFAMLEVAAGPVAGPLGPFNVVVWSCAIVLLVAGFVSMIAPPLAAARREGRRWLVPWIALLPAYYALMTVAAWRAAIELVAKPHYWSKTRHGVSRRLKPPGTVARRPPPD